MTAAYAYAFRHKLTSLIAVLLVVSVCGAAARSFASQTTHTARVVAASGSSANVPSPPVGVTTGVLAISQKPDNRLVPPTVPGERITSYTFAETIRVTVQEHIPRRVSKSYASTAPIIILYALPNGNTTEHTIGRTPNPEEDWHYAIQQIGAQTRQLNRHFNAPVHTIYLEANTLSWPTWRRNAEDSTGTLQKLFDHLEKEHGDTSDTVVLAAHSGGGSLVFGMLEAGLPEWIDKIILLDASYNYNAERHGERLEKWLQDPQHHFISIAYDDRSVLYDGKPLVSPTGGTWRANERMLATFDGWTSRVMEAGPGGSEYWTRPGAAVIHSADDKTTMAIENESNMMILNVRNPENKILHTTLVERNGLVWSVLRACRSLDSLQVSIMHLSKGNDTFVYPDLFERFFGTEPEEYRKRLAP